MSATTPTAKKAADIYEWAGGSAVNFEPVVIPAAFGKAVEAGLLPAERQTAPAATDGDESAPAAEDDPEALPCGHAPVWEESGTCMVCDDKTGARHDNGLTGELVRDQWGGRP